MMRYNLIRAILALSVVLSGLLIGTSYVNSMGEEAINEPPEMAGDPPGPTAISSQGKRFSGGYLVVYGNGGQIRFKSNHYTTYFDVDPYPGSGFDISFIAAEKLQQRCDDATHCAAAYLVLANTTTGDEQVIAKWIGRRRPHDIDRVGPGRWVVADIRNDQVYEIDLRDKSIEWAWPAQHHYPPLRSGGKYPNDFTHLNDVEVLPDGRVMASVRNHDSVVFIDPESGINQSMTLGFDDNHSLLFEQHNPDYIPSERGGPAVLVADSENNRVIEYERSRNEWVRSWVWSDDSLSWPRDADRLPNGHTLIADSHGNRALEINRSGDIVWSVYAPSVYDVERLGSGDESARGHSASSLGLPSRTEKTVQESPGPVEQIGDALRSIVPNKVIHAIRFVIPNWASLLDFTLALVMAFSGAGLFIMETLSRGYQFQPPIVRRD